jgi:hypothetical protein
MLNSKMPERPAAVAEARSNEVALERSGATFHLTGCVRIPVFGQGTPIFSSVRSEISVDQPDLKKMSSVGAVYSAQTQSRCRLYEALLCLGDGDLQRGRAYGAAKK